MKVLPLVPRRREVVTGIAAPWRLLFASTCRRCHILGMRSAAVVGALLDPSFFSSFTLKWFSGLNDTPECRILAEIGPNSLLYQFTFFNSLHCSHD